MTSDKTFTREEFIKKVKDFAQAMAEKVPGATVKLNPDPLSNGALISIDYQGKNQTSLLSLDAKGHVTMTNVFGA